MPERFSQKKARKVLGYISEAQKAAMAMRRRADDWKKRDAAAKLAANLRVPKEMFFESVKEHGIEKTLQELQTIKKISLALNIPAAEIAEMLKKHNIEQVCVQLIKEFQEQQQAGAIAA